MSYFEKFPLFIQDYIYKEKWEGLRAFQEETAEYIFNTDRDLLIATGTSSGKTEAVLFPVITKISTNPKKGVRVLYVTPLKALINDQFVRIKDILKDANVTVFKWHGDVNNSQKQKALESDNSILQITPESLESLFINHYESLSQLFKNLDYIIIDEIHYFLDSIRGLHLVCLLERLQRLHNKIVRYLCLSATLKNPNNVNVFLSRNIKSITSDYQKVKLRLLVDYHPIGFEAMLYHYINGYQTIVFANTRKVSEDMAIELKKINDSIGGNNYIYVHHGSISKELREEVELKLKREERIVVCATNTLELGIDIGSLERVIQINNPLSINSMVQRLGRTGRKGNAKEMVFCFNHPAFTGEYDNNQALYSNLNVSFAYTLTMIELYTKEKYLEEFLLDEYPYELLFQQTLSYLTDQPGSSINKLIDELLCLTPFKNITKEEYLSLLKRMKELTFIEQDSFHQVYLGKKGEELINDYHFYAMFDSKEVYDVYYNDKRLGQVDKPINDKVIFNLAGSSWIIDSINNRDKVIKVKPSKQDGDAIFSSNSSFIFDDKVIKKMFEMLANYTDLPYLSKSAKAYYQEQCQIYNQLTNNNQNDFIRIDDCFLYLPKCGSLQLNALLNTIRQAFPDAKIVDDEMVPLGIVIKTTNLNRLKQVISKLNNSIYKLNLSDGIKYHKYLPIDLANKRMLNRYLKID